MTATRRPLRDRQKRRCRRLARSGCNACDPRSRWRAGGPQFSPAGRTANPDPQAAIRGACGMIYQTQCGIPVCVGSAAKDKSPRGASLHSSRLRERCVERMKNECLCRPRSLCCTVCSCDICSAIGWMKLVTRSRAPAGVSSAVTRQSSAEVNVSTALASCGALSTDRRTCATFQIATACRRGAARHAQAAPQLVSGFRPADPPLAELSQRA